MKGIKLISTILIVIILTPFFIINISNADETVVDVVFEDENLYEAIRLALGDKVLEYHKNTITITQSNLDSIVYLDLSKKNISNITGIRNFKKLATLYLNDNNISNINEISELTNLNFLRLDNNNIKNISGLNDLTKLQTLYLYDNQITDITVVHKLLNLTCLNVANNLIKDASGVDALTNLKSLSLYGNQITDIIYVKELVNLEDLYLGSNEIEDISPLSNLKKLKILSLANNNIEDITSLKELKNLTSLGIGKNKISDISSLSDLKNLTELSLSYNNISDVSALEQLKINNLKLENQELKMKGEEGKRLTLPLIFKQAISNYGATSFDTFNCEINKSNNEVTINQNVSSATISINDGNLAGSILRIDVEDTTSPMLEVTYSEPDENTGAVIVKITSDEQIQEVEGWTLAKDGLSLTKVYNKNMEEKIAVKDLAGNITEISINVTTVVDKPTEPDIPIENLEVEVKYSTTKLTNQNVDVIIESNVTLKELDGWNLSEDKLTLKKTFVDNYRGNIRVVSESGIEKTVEILINNIDREYPSVELEYSTKEETTGKVTVKIKSKEIMQEIEGWILSDDRLTAQKVYSENTEEEVVIKDLAGNETIMKVKISNIIEQKEEEDKEKGTENISVPVQQEKTTTSSTVSPAKSLPKAGLAGRMFIIGIAILASVIFYNKWNKYRKY